MVIPIIYFLLLISFLGIQLYLWRIWKKKSTSKSDLNIIDFPSVTILIPVHNEEENIENCLRSLSNQNYPSSVLQIIVINDHSTDQTAVLSGKFTNVKVIDQIDKISGKKAALQKGIGSATGEVILTIDGDCEVGENWVATMVQQLVDNPNVLATGPVWMVPENPGFLSKFQEMEQASLNVITHAGLQSGMLLSAIGANMAYPKSLYLKLDPYADNQHIPSGDDVFFAQRVHQTGDKVLFVRHREAVVYTTPVARFSDFIRQRIRWAGKSSGYTHWPTKLYLVGFATFNLSFVFLLITGVWHPVYYSYLFYGLLLKFVVDYLIIHTGMRWGNRPVCWQDVLKASLFQVVYVVYISALFLVGKRDGWKE